MTVAVLIEQLKALPSETEVRFLEYGGCEECNPEAFAQYHYIERVSFQDALVYPYHGDKNAVVLE